MLKKLVFAAASVAGLGGLACGTAASPTPNTAERALTGTAPAGSNRVLVVDADGAAFSAAVGTDGSFRVAIDSLRPVSVFVVGADTRVLRVAATAGAAPSLTSLPAWQGEVSTAQMSTCDCNEDGVDEEVEAAENPLDQIDSDDDGTANSEDDDDDNDGDNDDGDVDSDGDGHDDDDDDLDSDDDGRPDLCDDDDDNDGAQDDDAHEGDHDDDGVADDDDQDDDNDGIADDEDEDDETDGGEGEGESDG